jgi:hypothetical protein
MSTPATLVHRAPDACWVVMEFSPSEHDELAALRAENARLRRSLELTPEQARPNPPVGLVSGARGWVAQRHDPPLPAAHRPGC